MTTPVQDELNSSKTSITVEFRVREGGSCFSFVPIVSAATLISRRSQSRRGSVPSSAPSVGPARNVCSLGGVPTVAASWSRGLGVRLRNWQSFPLQQTVSSSPKDAEVMGHRRRELDRPLPNWSAALPMTPNHAMQRTVTSGLRPPVPAADGGRWATRKRTWPHL